MISSSVPPSLTEQTTQVLVVGAGPVGLFAAFCAARRGLRVTVLEQRFRSYARGHATVLHPSSLRMLAELNLSLQLLDQGHQINQIQLRVDGAQTATLELPLFALTLTQSVLEELLLKELRKLEVDIRAPYEATLLTQQQNFVQTRVVRRELVSPGSSANDGRWEPIESSVINADFVIGADGYDSRVRGALGFESLEVGRTQTFATFEGQRSQQASAIELTFQGGLASATLPLPAQRNRWSFQLGSDFGVPADLSYLRKLLSERGGSLGQVPNALEWSTVTHFERRLARRFGGGRVWLAGDAAHTASPFGSQSMNGGLTEAHDLVEVMASCLLEGKPIAQLEQLGAAREREWHKLLGFNVQFDAEPNAPAWIREHARELIPALPVSGQDLQEVLRQLGVTVR
jgi:2-polyprenyl-6-methoxyphenol hydroxylase-like FAD-dependent oxidoreductase